MHRRQREWRVQSPSERNGIVRHRVEPVREVLRDGDVTTVHLQGDLDLATVSKVSMVLADECARHPEELLIDLSAVDFIDSSGLRLFVDTHRRLMNAGCLLVLASPSDAVWRTFVMTNLDGTLLFRHSPALGGEKSAA